jgi:hypothetical protein
MTAAITIRQARAAGVLLRVEGDDLLLEAPARPPPRILEMLARHKPAIVLRLRPGADGWSRDDWHSYFDQRAGLAEFDAGLSRDHAEALAFSCCVPEWLNRNPVHSAPGRCLGCGAAEHPNDPLLPFGVESAGHAWLHSRCWRAWAEGRKAEAFSALAVIGIAAPVNLPNNFGENGDA